MNTSVMEWPSFEMQGNQSFSAYGLRACLAVSEDGNFFFVAGGAFEYDKNTKMTAFEVYDVVNDEIISGPDLSEIRANHACTVKDNRLYIFGGDGDLDSVEMIDVANPSQIHLEEWEHIGSLQSARGVLRGVVFDDNIYIIGGKRSGSNTNYVDMIDVNTDSVSICSPLPSSLSSGCAVSTESVMYYTRESVVYYVDICMLCMLCIFVYLYNHSML